MDIEAIISQSGRELKTLRFKYLEKDGTYEGFREVEPYSFRNKSGITMFYGFDVAKDGIRQFNPEMIHGISITDNSFNPRSS